MASEIIVQTIKGPTSGSNANKVIIPSGQTLDASEGFIPPAGSVVQMVHHKFFDVTTSTTTDTWVDCAGSTVSITPQYSNSKLVFTMTTHQQNRDGEQLGVAPYYKVGSGNYARISTASTFNEVSRIANGGTLVWDTGAQTWELPVTSTDTVTLKIMIKTRFGGSVRLNDNGPGSGFLILEVKQ